MERVRHYNPVERAYPNVIGEADIVRHRKWRTSWAKPFHTSASNDARGTSKQSHDFGYGQPWRLDSTPVIRQSKQQHGSLPRPVHPERLTASTKEVRLGMDASVMAQKIIPPCFHSIIE